MGVAVPNYRNGLVLTNHHCAVRRYQGSTGSTEHNFLRDGFWAADYESELHIPVKQPYPKRVEDVTPQVKGDAKEWG